MADQSQALTQQLMADPEIQHWVTLYRQTANPRNAAEGRQHWDATQQISRLTGGRIPDGYTFNPAKGVVTRDNRVGHFVDKHFNTIAAIPGLIGGGWAIGSALGGGAPAASASGPAVSGPPTGAVTGTVVDPITGAAVGAPAAGVATATGAGATGAAASQLPSWVKEIGKGALAAAPILAGAATGGFGSSAAPMPPELTQLLQEAMRRLTAQGPLQDAVNRQALAGLPRYARGE